MKIVAFCLPLVIGCGARVFESPAGDAAVTEDTRSVVTNDTYTPVDEDVSFPSDDVVAPPPDDAVSPPPEDVGPPSGTLAECFGAMGKSNPSTLKDLIYDFSTCMDAKCQMQLNFNAGCSIELRNLSMSATRATTTDKEDCDLLRRWATSERLLGALDPTSEPAKACRAMEDGTKPFESTIVGGTEYRMKTFYCKVEPFVTHRVCLQRVIQKYFPPK